MSFLNRWQCKLLGLLNSIRFGIKFEGCDHIEQEHHENVEVLITKCRRCNKTDIGWGKNLKP